ncbi:hypothetical protein BGZ83_010213 [Gryganskiella cystojenkinii]|nr:hypothetical protein BGZ83_010213 [Gryganskiella cystojenkinii]
MLVASFLAGNIPLSFHLSEDRLKLISNFGVGLLVGTSLVVIIPEGVETLYSAPSAASPSPSAANSGVGGHNNPIKRSLMQHPDATASGFSMISGLKRAAAQTNSLFNRADKNVVALTEPGSAAYKIQDQFMSEIEAKSPAAATSFGDNMLMTRREEHNNKRQAPDGDKTDKADDGLDGGDETDETDDHESKDKVPNNGDHDNESGHDHEEGEENEAHKYIGLALISGFILMFLIDQMGPTHAHSHNNHVSVADFTELHNLQLDDSNIRMPSAAGMNASAKKRGNPITIGLVVHAAADGIALGASATKPELRLIVFLAIMLHKAPAAFGLSTVLLQHGFSRRQTRQQLAIFSLAAPIGALATYIFIQLSGQHEAASLHWWTGMLLLFSGGTFLYVAMHVMSEMNNNSDRSSSANGYSVGGAGDKKGLSVGEVLCVIGGMIVPLILSVDHEH